MLPAAGAMSRTPTLASAIQSATAATRRVTPRRSILSRGHSLPRAKETDTATTIASGRTVRTKNLGSTVTCSPRNTDEKAG